MRSDTVASQKYPVLSRYTSVARIMSGGDVYIISLTHPVCLAFGRTCLQSVLLRIKACPLNLFVISMDLRKPCRISRLAGHD